MALCLSFSFISLHFLNKSKIYRPDLIQKKEKSKEKVDPHFNPTRIQHACRSFKRQACLKYKAILPILLTTLEAWNKLHDYIMELTSSQS